MAQTDMVTKITQMLEFANTDGAALQGVDEAELEAAFAAMARDLQRDLDAPTDPEPNAP